jgi:hypothetical protein
MSGMPPPEALQHILFSRTTDKTDLANIGIADDVHPHFPLIQPFFPVLYDVSEAPAFSFQVAFPSHDALYHPAYESTCSFEKCS